MPVRERDQFAGGGHSAVSFGIILGVILVTIAVAVAMVRTARAGSPSQAPSEPSLVSLRLRDIPAKEAYAEVAKAAGVRISYSSAWPSDKLRVSLNLVHEPFWQAMAQIGNTSGMHVQHVRRAPQQEVVLIPSNNMKDHRPVARSADGLFFATLIDHARDSERAKPVNPTNRFASFLTVTLVPEPKVRPLLWHSIKVEELVDDTGRAIEPKQYPRTATLLRGQGVLPLHLPERPWPRRIGRMRVTGKVLAATNAEVAEITDLMSATSPTASAAGFRIETTSRDMEDGRRMIRMQLTRTGNAPEWMRPVARLDLLEPVVMDKQGRYPSFFVLDRDWFGRTCRFDVVVSPPQGKTRSSRQAGPPDRLIMEIPTDVTEYDVRLEFKDVTLY